MVDGVADFLGRYVALPRPTLTVAALWVVASWLDDLWDRFPNLAVTSPEKRCGKTRLLQVLELVVRAPCNVSNISPAAVYRQIAAERSTLLIDEAQALTRRGSEQTEVLRELLCAGIDKKAQVVRVGGANNDEVRRFPVYAPKVIALIGEPDGVVADRCLPVRLRRKTAADTVERYKSRVAEPAGGAVRDRVEAWAAGHRDRVREVYDALEPFDVGNDRMAELLLPLMAVADVDASAGGGCHLPVLAGYAADLDRADAEAERMTPGVRLLAALRDIFADADPDGRGVFLGTGNLIASLAQRTEEPWAEYTRGQPITAEGLATLLRPFGIQSRRNAKQTVRGYGTRDFREAWERYLPPLPQPVCPVYPSTTAGPGQPGAAAPLVGEGGGIPSGLAELFKKRLHATATAQEP